MMDTIAQQLTQARHRLQPVAQHNAALEARMLAAHAWNMSPEALLLHDREPRDAADFAALIERRLTAEPIAQIIGKKAFWKASFFVSRDVLTPRADSETLIETLLRLRPDRNVAYRMLDLGTGTGCLILSALGEYSRAQGVAADRSPTALAIAEKNAAALHLTQRCTLLQSSWCSNIAGTFDIILSNPPYIPSADIAALDADVRLHEPLGALDGGTDGLDCYRSILNELTPCVKSGSLLLFEVGLGQAYHVAKLGLSAGWKLLEITDDLAGIPRVVALEFI